MGKVAEAIGVKFTVTTEMRRGNEEFTNFFTNRKPINKSLSNTAKQHGTTSQSVSTDKGSEESSDTQEKSEKGAQYSLQGNSLTEEEQRIVDEAKANGTFDASNPDIRYSLASDMARDAVMTALEGAGIDVEMATPEMVEDVLRARDAEFHIAYHGSGAKFDEFDHSHMGEGEGRKISRIKGIAEDLPYKDGVKNFDEENKKNDY